MDHFFARDYLPQTGRFNGSDPVMEYSNPYSYVANRPLNFVDPLGMQQDNESKIGGRNPRDDPHWDDNQFLTRSRKNYQDNWEQVWAPSISMPPGYASSGGSTAGYLRNHPGGGAAEKGGYWRKIRPRVFVAKGWEVEYEVDWIWVEAGRDETNTLIDENNNPYYESPTYIDEPQQINELWVPVWATPGRALVAAKGMSNAWNYFQHINKGKKVTSAMYEAWKSTAGHKLWQAKSYIYNNYPLYADFANSFSQGTVNGNIPKGVLNKIAYGIGYIFGNNPFGL